MSKATDTIAQAKATRAIGTTPEGWRHDGWLCYYHTSGAHFDNASMRLYRPGIGGCYAYDIHEASAILATGVRFLLSVSV